MRYIALTLLLLNLAYLGWNLWQRQLPTVAARPTAAPLAGAPLVLLAELGDTADPDSVQATGEGRCTRAGEFASLEDAELLIEEARAMGLVARLALTGERLPPLYRVFLPPYSSREVAALGLATLQGDPGVVTLVQDIYLITRGGLENGIALGIFPAEEAAEAVRARLEALGYPARTGEVARAEGPVFVLLQSAAGGPISAENWAQLVLDRPYLSGSENVC